MVFSITHTIGKQSKTRMPRGLKVSCLLIVNMMEFINIILWRVTQTTSIPSVVVSIVFTTEPLCRWFCILTRPWAWWCAQTFGTIVEMLKHAQDDSFSMMELAKKYGTTTTHYTRCGIQCRSLVSGFTQRYVVKHECDLVWVGYSTVDGI